MRQNHDLKIWPEFFDAVKRGQKTFEVRENDRHFRVADTVTLKEWLPTTKTYTGREAICSITYVMTGGQFGIAEGVCVFSFKVREFTESFL